MVQCWSLKSVENRPGNSYRQGAPMGASCALFIFRVQGGEGGTLLLYAGEALVQYWKFQITIF